MTLTRPARYSLRLDQAAAWTGLRETRALRTEMGRGVLIAIIDTGMDWRHEDFIDDAGQSRVAWLLDQTLPPVGLHADLEALGDGAVFSRIELQAALDGENEIASEAGRDPFGHGTHIAGIAAGGNPIYQGLAPEAELIVVKAVGAEGTVDEARVLAGLAFCLEAARQAGKPLVVNLSLGDQLGAHDGTSPLELALASAVTSTNPPCAVSVAAGNEGEQNRHARLRLRLKAPPERLAFHLPGAGQILIDLWYEEDGPLCMALENPAGEELLALCPGHEPTQISLTSTSGTVNLATERQAEKALGRVLLEFSGDELASGTWILELLGQSRRVDAWVADYDRVTWPWPHFLSHKDHANLVGPPATARGVLAVGAFAARDRWQDQEGVFHAVSGWPGLRTAFSSRGPSRDGRLKPDLLAPGLSVASSLSSDADPRSTQSIFFDAGSTTRVLPGGRHAVASGTSMAAPYVAGLCALIFEAHPDWTGIQVRQAVIAASRLDVGGTDARGHGAIHVLNSLRGSDAEVSLAMDPAHSLCTLSEGWLPMDAAQPIQVVFVPRDASGLPAKASATAGRTIKIESIPAGAPFEGEVEEMNGGIFIRHLRAGGLEGQSYRMRCSLGEQVAEEQPYLQINRGGTEKNEGGCSTGMGSGLWGLLLLFLHRLHHFAHRLIVGRDFMGRLQAFLGALTIVGGLRRL